MIKFYIEQSVLSRMLTRDDLDQIIGFCRLLMGDDE
jgi:hypothetical protein